MSHPLLFVKFVFLIHNIIFIGVHIERSKLDGFSPLVDFRYILNRIEFFNPVFFDDGLSEFLLLMGISADAIVQFRI